MTDTDSIIIDDGNCFACGEDNPIGLKLKFRIDRTTETAVSETVIAGHFNGWKGVVHGGIITTLLDEIMVYACTSTGWSTVTGTIEVKFHRPVPTGKKLTITGKVLENRGRSILASGTVELQGKLLASATSVLIPMKYNENAMDTIAERLIQ
jgi:uncharacterized protein (TIGR00369 family)